MVLGTFAYDGLVFVDKIIPDPQMTLTSTHLICLLVAHNVSYFTLEKIDGWIKTIINCHIVSRSGTARNFEIHPIHRSRQAIAQVLH